MKNNQKHTREEMFRKVEEWMASGLSQPQYCKQEGFPLTTFSHWLQKYRKEKGITTTASPGPFIPVEVTSSLVHPGSTTHVREITITYPNGIEVKCPADIGTLQLKTLLTI